MDPGAPQLYVDYFSQPSRAVIIFIKANSLPVSLSLVKLGQGEHLKPDHKAINPLSRVPFLSTPEGLQLPESIAILKYLANRYQDRVPGHFYPPAAADPEGSARVAAATAWWLGSLRSAASPLVFSRVLAPRLGRSPAPGIAEDAEARLKQGLRELDTYWLDGGKRDFMAGGTGPSIADILAASELEQLRLLPESCETMTTKEAGGAVHPLVASRPVVCRWLVRVSEALSPHYDDAHVLLRRGVARGASSGAKAPRKGQEDTGGAGRPPGASEAKRAPTSRL